MGSCVVALEQRHAAAPPPAERHDPLRLEQRIRALPIRWRIFAIAGLNTAVVLLLAALIWDGAKVLSAAWMDLGQVRRSDGLLVSLQSDAVRLQSLIHRYFNQPQPDLLQEIEQRRETLLKRLRTQAPLDPSLARPLAALTELTERFLAGFDQLREVRSAISRIYEQEVLQSARDMAGLYAVVEGATANRQSLIWPSLSKSRDAFSATLVAANAYYLSLASEAAEEAYRNLAAVDGTIPSMLDHADSDLQRGALGALGFRAAALRLGLNRLAENFANQARLLRDTIDGNQTAMVGLIDRLSDQMRAREQRAQTHFDDALSDVYIQVGLVAVAFLVLISGIGVAIASSISTPLRELEAAMHAIASGDYDRRVHGLAARDEIGEMARAVEVFRENAIARRRAEEELRASKERAEHALSELRDAQKSLIEAEKLAALGGLVAGVAHEVNNPIGISLTVASSLARRCESFAAEFAAGPLRRSRLMEFLDGNREAAEQLVANLQRAGDLVQSFKQVAVDRSHEQRRPFDLRESTEQIAASLRPGLKRARVQLTTQVPGGLVLDSDPGAYGQVLTNLVLNAATHGFADGRCGTIQIEARPLEPAQVEIAIVDNGAGMTDEVQRRAFEPFFTTRRHKGGTGLGLHIVYSLITRRLGGRITVTSAPERGTTARIVLPRTAPPENPSATNSSSV
jgi:signal transduction histidine kinase